VNSSYLLLIAKTEIYAPHVKTDLSPPAAVIRGSPAGISGDTRNMSDIDSQSGASSSADSAELVDARDDDWEWGDDEAPATARCAPRASALLLLPPPPSCRRAGPQRARRCACACPR